jgi:hypothetical protein
MSESTQEHFREEVLLSLSLSPPPLLFSFLPAFLPACLPFFLPTYFFALLSSFLHFLPSFTSLHFTSLSSRFLLSFRSVTFFLSLPSFLPSFLHFLPSFFPSLTVCFMAVVAID